jgi:hypothetical protein
VVSLTTAFIGALGRPFDDRTGVPCVQCAGLCCQVCILKYARSNCVATNQMKFKLHICRIYKASVSPGVVKQIMPRLN